MAKQEERKPCDGCGRWHGAVGEMIACMSRELGVQRAARLKAEQQATRALDTIIAVRNVVR